MCFKEREKKIKYKCLKRHLNNIILKYVLGRQKQRETLNNNKIGQKHIGENEKESEREKERISTIILLPCFINAYVCMYIKYVLEEMQLINCKNEISLKGRQVN